MVPLVPALTLVYEGDNLKTMSTITIPKNLIKNDDLVILPKKEYENLINKRVIPVARLTSSERNSLHQSRKEMARGEYITLEELEHDLETAYRKKRC